MTATPGRYEVRFAESPTQVRKAQELRTRIYSHTFSARFTGLDQDRYDSLCDHLLVQDREGGEVVGTYRLLRSDRLPPGEIFYTEQEFCVHGVKSRYRQVLELGRSCVHPSHRTGTVLGLLWMGIGHYVRQHGIDVVIGCASFPGTDVNRHAPALRYLVERHAAPESVRPQVLAKYHRAIPGSAQSLEQTMPELPPLIKGYLRVGCRVGEGYYVDEVCGTVDVCMMLDRQWMTRSYATRFLGENAGAIKEPA